MSTVTLNIPDSVETTEFELKMTLAAKLFEEGKVSSGQAAEIVGISKRSFIELVGSFGVSVFGYDNLDAEISTKK
jgi:predicted HTH domain antitoxin